MFPLTVKFMVSERMNFRGVPRGRKSLPPSDVIFEIQGMLKAPRLTKISESTVFLFGGALVQDSEL